MEACDNMIWKEILFLIIIYLMDLICYILTESNAMQKLVTGSLECNINAMKKLNSLSTINCARQHKSTNSFVSLYSTTA